MLRIPRKAWPALTQFAPERFPKLQFLYDTLESGSDEMKFVHAELETLTRAFQKWAKAFLRVHRDAGLLALGSKIQIQQQQEQEYWAPRFAALAGADLTLTEYGRLMRHLTQHLDRPLQPVEDALQALEKPWKYRDPKLT